MEAFFRTFECDPAWPEFRERTPNAAPWRVARVFRSRFEMFKEDLFARHHVVAYSYVIEYHTRGLPRARVLLFVARGGPAKGLMQLLRNQHDPDDTLLTMDEYALKYMGKTGP